MAQDAGGTMTAPRKATVESVEEEIARTRERLMLTLTQINGDVRALLDPDAAVVIAPAGNRDAVDKVAVGLRTAGQITALARPAKAGPFGVVRAVTGLTVFLLGSGLVRRLWQRKRG